MEVALSMGWPIAMGVIEGACRYLVKDRLAIAGARWSLPGAEAVLLQRAVITNGRPHASASSRATLCPDGRPGACRRPCGRVHPAAGIGDHHQLRVTPPRGIAA
jgi:hypothetical protein